MGKDLSQIQFYNVKLVDKQIENGNIWTFWFQKPEGVNWTEGSHLHIAFKDFLDGEIPDKEKVRHMSIISNSNEDSLGITTRIPEESSYFKKRIQDIEVGDEVILYKLSSRMELRRQNRPLILISMGVGLSTFRPLILKYRETSENIKRLTSLNVDSGESFLYKQEIDQLNVDDFENHYLSSREELYREIDKALCNIESIYYVVGSDQFLKDISNYLIENDVKAEDIIIDKKPEKRSEFIEL